MMQNATGLETLSFGHGQVFGEVVGKSLSEGDRRTLKETYLDSLFLLLPFINNHPIHVYLPLPERDPFHHVSFQGCFDFEQVIPFLSKTPNAITVVDGRSCGFLRVRLVRLEGERIERLAEIEIYLDRREGEYGFELYWGRDERPTWLRCYDGTRKVLSLVEEWGNKFRLMRSYPEVGQAIVC